MEAADTMEGDEPLTPTGRIFLQPHMEQVANAAIALETAFDADAFKSELQSSVLLKIPRFCSLLVRDSGGREYWRRTKVDVDRHVIVCHQPISDDPSISDEDAVNDFMADLSFSSPLPTDKPLWEIHLLMAHNTVVFRAHHALGDGISLMSMLLSCCRRIDDPTQPPIIGVAASAPKRRLSVWNLMMVVWYTLVYVFELTLRILWLRDKITAVSGGAGVELWPRKLATARFRLEDMKIVKRVVANATINDVLMGVISHGLSTYLGIRSSKALPEGLQITGLAMVNLRPQPGLQDMPKLLDSTRGWGNKFGILLLPVYYHKDGSDPIQFVKRAKDMIDKKKLSLEAPFSYGVAKLLTSLFGAKAITMHMVSYGSVADLNILVAKEVIPDPKVLAKCFEDALLQLKLAAESKTKS